MQDPGFNTLRMYYTIDMKYKSDCVDFVVNNAHYSSMVHEDNLVLATKW